MAFKDIIGNAQTIRLLKMACASGRMVHAYAFCGPAHIGKRTTALQFAKALNCLKPIADGDGVDACDECKSCKHIEMGISLDVQVIAPTPSSGVGDGAVGFSIRIDDMRRMRSDAALSARHSRFKVYIVDNAELATEEAANCILKTLEEPPPNVVIILVTANPAALPRTVISRCQILRFRLVTQNEIASALMKLRGLDEERAWLFAKLSQGRPGMALAFSESEGVIEALRDAAELFSEAVNAQPIDAIRLPERIVWLGARFSNLIPKGATESAEVERRHAIKGVDVLLRCAREALAMMLGTNPKEIMMEGIAKELLAAVSNKEPQRLRQLIDALVEARRDLLLNANVQLAIEAALLRFIRSSRGIAD